MTIQTSLDGELRARAAKVVPGGMYGHMNGAQLPSAYPQFFARGDGPRLWDVDGNEYIDMMCSYGPIVLGHRHPSVEAAVAAQQAEGDCFSGPSARLVELAELLVDTLPAADWAMFCKNGTDATTLCLTIARAATGRATVLAATGSYHGAAPWCTPNPTGTTPADRSNIGYFDYNDLASVEQAAQKADGDLAAIIVTPFRHDANHDQELIDQAFARGLRDICDRTGAALILDDVRCGFRLDMGGSWEPIGVRPDLSAWSKAIANGYALAAVTGADALREAVTRVYTTGSFWFSSVSMAAAIATITTLREIDGPAVMERAGRRLRDGLAAQATTHGLRINQTGPAQIPFLSFADDADREKANLWTTECVRGGVILHPWHNWFLSAAHTDDDIDAALVVTDAAFAATRARFGTD
ncbi:aminotransferase class III-fold pyridoxal phosphate-dependent enzyme [Streptomyces sp. NPDC006668]|uniref:aminotransferase class III-fold pyridoxal phosphate-dependent enzyme n=1 Tax=Streptomyces sp. NPDC006668 TaxID=3156903 RepID=UPI0033C607C0